MKVTPPLIVEKMEVVRGVTVLYAMNVANRGIRNVYLVFDMPSTSQMIHMVRTKMRAFGLNMVAIIISRTLAEAYLIKVMESSVLVALICAKRANKAQHRDGMLP